MDDLPGKLHFSPGDILCNKSLNYRPLYRHKEGPSYRPTNLHIGNSACCPCESRFMHGLVLLDMR